MPGGGLVEKHQHSRPKKPNRSNIPRQEMVDAHERATQARLRVFLTRSLGPENPSDISAVAEAFQQMEFEVKSMGSLGAVASTTGGMRVV